MPAAEGARVSDPSFKPSEVFLNAIPPLTATMGRFEREFAAALLVRACQVDGDAWRGFTPAELGKVIARDLEAKVEPMVSWNRNPFLRPDFRDLVAQGFAACTDLDNGAPVEFTERGLEALRRWVRPGSATPNAT
jgi:hypothetical protein